MNAPRVTVLGLGRMGSALARALVAGGAAVTVWNREPARAYAFAGRARVASDPAAACAASELVLISLADYGASLEVLDAAAAGAELSGRTLVQLSSGTPSDARTLAAWSGLQGAHYLDGAIVGHPGAIGSNGVVLLFAGDEAAFEHHRETLALLGPASQFIDGAPGAAAALDCALLACFYGSHLAMLHGAALCDSEQIPQRFYFNVLRTVGARLGDHAETARAMIERENYSGTENTLAVHLATLRHVQRLSHDNEVDPRLPDALLQLCRKAAGAGHAEDELPSVFEILRRRAE